MKISRLFEITYLLLDKKIMTARELAEHFGVSTRTIYRDVDILSQAGIPIYASKGSGGGIRLTDNFILNKSVFTQEEKQSILASLNSMNALKVNEMQPVLDKMSALFGGEREDWIEIDFSSWNPNNPISCLFDVLKKNILERNVTKFNYSSANGNTDLREVEPLKLVFRERGWYLLAWCRLRNDFRYFKLSRMSMPTDFGECFERRKIPESCKLLQRYVMPTTEVTARIASEMSYRVLDELQSDQFTRQEDGSFLVRFEMPDNDWLYQYLMTYGASIYVVGPQKVKEELHNRLKSACIQYET